MIKYLLTIIEINKIKKKIIVLIIQKIIIKIKKNILGWLTLKKINFVKIAF